MTFNPIPNKCSVCDPKLHCACEQYLPGDYLIVATGINWRDNHYDKIVYHRHVENRNTYHYRDGSCYLNAPDGSTIYNNKRGETRYTPPEPAMSVPPLNAASFTSPSRLSSVPIKEEEDVHGNSEETISDAFVKVEIKEE